MRKVERITIICQQCGSSFQERASRKRKYCGRLCSKRATAARYDAARVNRVCLQCGNSFRVRPALASAKYCGWRCHQIGVSRTSAEKRGDKLRGRGQGKTYIKLRGRHAHRVIAEEKIARPLVPGEIVHHDDEDKRNNEPDNLVVLPSQAEHARIHANRRHGNRV